MEKGCRNGKHDLLTREEFEQGYVECSQITLDQLHEFGLQVITCDCGDELCKGWAMVHKEEPALLTVAGISFFHPPGGATSLRGEHRGNKI